MSPSPTLYEIEDQLIGLIESLEMIPAEDQQCRAPIEESIRQVMEAEIQKVDRIGHMLAHFGSQAELAAAECKRLQTRKKAYERWQESLKHYVQIAMHHARVKKLEGETTTLFLRTSPASVSITDIDMVPAEYKEIRTEIVVDKEAIKRALKIGKTVPGAGLADESFYLVRK